MYIDILYIAEITSVKYTWPWKYICRWNNADTYVLYALALEGKTIKENNEISFELIKTGNILWLGMSWH